MEKDDLNVLSAYMAVAEERSFTRAAKRSGVSQSALSHSIRGLEERLGVRLLSRTTRSVAPTDAGAELLAHLGPALADIRGTLDKLAGLRGKPAGRVRMVASRLAAKSGIASVLRVTSQAQIAAGSSSSPLHQLPAWLAGSLPLGV